MRVINLSSLICEIVINLRKSLKKVIQKLQTVIECCTFVVAIERAMPFWMILIETNIYGQRKAGEIRRYGDL